MNENIPQTEEFEPDWLQIGEKLNLYSVNKRKRSVVLQDPPFEAQKHLDTTSNNLDLIYLIEVGVKKPSEQVILKKLISDMQQRYALIQQRGKS